MMTDDSNIREFEAIESYQRGPELDTLGNRHLLPTPHEHLEEFHPLWMQMNSRQRRFCLALVECGGDWPAAAEVTGIHPGTARNWKSQGVPIETVYDLMLADARQSAQEMLKASVGRAVQVKAEALDSSDERARQRAASEIINWVIGKPTARTEVSGPEKGPVEMDVRQVLREKIERMHQNKHQE